MRAWQRKAQKTLVGIEREKGGGGCLAGSVAHLGRNLSSGQMSFGFLALLAATADICTLEAQRWVERAKFSSMSASIAASLHITLGNRRAVVILVNAM